MSSLINNAKDILKLNDCGSFTVPARSLYPHLWAWDSAFSAIGWSYIDMERGFKELEFLMKTIWDDGRIPHITFNQEHISDYFPGPNVWGHPNGSAISQPPVWALAFEILVERGLDIERIRPLLPLIEASHLFFRSKRDPLKKNLLAICHPWESGMDNCPAWDEPLKNVPQADLTKIKRVDKTKVEDVSERPTDDHYRGYIGLVNQLVESSFESTSFNVYDPMMTTALIIGEESLARLATKLNFETKAQSRADEMKAALTNELYDNTTGRYFYLDAQANTKYKIRSLGSLFPLLVINDGNYAKSLATLKAEHFTEYPLATVPLDDSSVEPSCYWRGPTWVNVNWLFRKHLDETLLNQTVKMIEREGFREYYHPKTGKGLGATEFSWTAALIIDWLERG